ncbi:MULTISPECIES: histidine phosphatase family protein [Neptunomonas]|uniref:Histidine phosphatase family protein n=1 Tax=Neptunomonas marina TaxID=1815562 RepID=A0A437Q489_9GAMM|nr:MULTISPECIES: histidine phosphatase family protein [Neptunomonas]RVU29292.1 histidine phosphatase family protein [Neptunomonas marina]
MALYLIRHGETPAGKAYIGRTDAPLSTVGWEQMTAALKGYSPQQFAAIYSSPLQRCAAFAEQWSNSGHLLEPALQEYDFGILDGLSGAEAYADHRDVLLAFWEDPVNGTPPQAEQLRHFEQRVTHALSKIAKHHGDEDVLIFTHGGVIKLAIAHLRQQSLHTMFEIEAPHASVHRLDWSHT